MDGYLLLFTALKILVVILFVVNTAAILTWGERRQSAMIQDRIGPNRAVIYVPGWIVKVLALGVGFGLAAAAGAYAFAASRRPEAVRLDAGFMLTELAILVGWSGRRPGRRRILGGRAAFQLRRRKCRSHRPCRRVNGGNRDGPVAVFLS